jgi:hypothetical protein
MKKCTYCGRKYPDDAKVCAIDQMELESDKPVPSVVTDERSAAGPIDADEGFEVPEGYRPLGSFDPFDASSLLHRFEQAGIRFLIDRVEQSVETGRSVRKRALIQIYVHLDDNEQASQILSEDWKV